MGSCSLKCKCEDMHGEVHDTDINLGTAPICPQVEFSREPSLTINFPQVMCSRMMTGGWFAMAMKGAAIRPPRNATITQTAKTIEEAISDQELAFCQGSATGLDTAFVIIDRRGHETVEVQQFRGSACGRRQP